MACTVKFKLKIFSVSKKIFSMTSCDNCSLHTLPYKEVLATPHSKKLRTFYNRLLNNCWKPKSVNLKNISILEFESELCLLSIVVERLRDFCFFVLLHVPATWPLLTWKCWDNPILFNKIRKMTLNLHKKLSIKHRLSGISNCPDVIGDKSYEYKYYQDSREFCQSSTELLRLIKHEYIIFNSH